MMITFQFTYTHSDGLMREHLSILTQWTTDALQNNKSCIFSQLKFKNFQLARIHCNLGLQKQNRRSASHFKMIFNKFKKTSNLAFQYKV